MNVLSWNCRGHENLWTVQDFHRMVKDKKPMMVFLIKTKLQATKMEVLNVKLGFGSVFMVDSVRK
jgi:hypothetical protein